MHQNFHPPPSCLLMLLLLTGCQLLNPEPLPEEQFYRIFNNNSFDNFKALDIRELPNGEGYIILGSCTPDGSNAASTPHLVRTNMAGEVLWETPRNSPLSQFSYPVASLQITNGAYRFFAMRGEQTVLLSIAPDGGQVEILNTLSENNPIPYASSALPNGDFLLLTIAQNCAASEYATQLSRISASGQVLWQQCHPSRQTGSGLLLGYTDEFFQCGAFQKDGKEFYYFISWLDDGVALAFIDAAQGNVVEKHSSIDISSFTNIIPMSVAHLGGENFAAAFTNETLVDMRPDARFLGSSPTDISQQGNIFHELIPDKRIVIKALETNNRTMVFYAANARNNQIILYAFEPGRNLLRGRISLGNSNPYVVANILQTSDGGMAITGYTFVAGRFSRIFFFKLSEESISDLAQQCVGLGLCN